MRMLFPIAVLPMLCGRVGLRDMVFSLLLT